MKRFVLLLAILLAGHLCRGQSLSMMHYWFDEDFAIRQSLSSHTQMVDASMLDEGIHTLHVQMSDTCPVVSSLFYRIEPSMVHPADSLHYWFDEDFANRQQMTGNVQTIDASHLSSGIHTFHVQIGRDRPVTSSLFYRIEPSMVHPADSLHYWFDEDFANWRQMTGNVQTIDASHLSLGIHTLFVQIGDNRPVSSVLFYKTLTTDTDTFGILSYWFDEDFANRRQMTGNVQTIDASQLNAGIHILHVQMGADRPVTSALFYKKMSSMEESVGNLYYWFDEDFASRQQMAGNVQTIDASALSEGIHTFHVQMGDNRPVVSALFYNALTNSEYPTECYYTFNGSIDYTFGYRDTIGTLPSNWIDLMEVDTFPFCSQRFHFEKNEADHYWAYSKNVISVMVMAKGHVLTDSKPYVDRRVGYEVIADTFPRNTYKQFSKPTNNHIQWYHIPVERGDSMAFKASRTCTMQLFAPDGTEVYRAAYDTATRYTGLHAFQTGTYYLAVHDATYSGTENLGVDYFHCDRFAVLSQDVHRVGNGGISAITFEGNGFDSISSVVFVRGTDTIRPINLYALNRNTLMVVYDFEGVDTGVYNAIFDFSGTELLLANNLTVETAKSLHLVTSINYPSSFTRGGTVTYKYTVTNTGNMTAFNVPIHSYISTNSKEDVSYLKLEGFDLEPLESSFPDNLLTDEDKMFLAEYEQEYGNEYIYMGKDVYDSIKQTNFYVRSNHFFCNIAPYETKHITLTIRSTGGVDVWFSTPFTALVYIDNNGDTLSHQTQSMMKQSDTGYLHDTYCCIADMADCMLNDISLILTDVSTVANIAACITASIPYVGEVTVPLAAAADAASCITGTASFIANANQNLFCKRGTKLDLSLLVDKALLVNSLVGTAAACIKGVVPEASIAKLFPSLEKVNWFSAITTLVGTPRIWCNSDDFYDKWYDCPPRYHDGGSSSANPPVDPNELVGFVAESGSTFMPDTVQTIDYYIECENDPLEALAAAHKVVIVDTLDINQYDLNSFMPTRVSIGHRNALLDGSQHGTYTMDLRPETNALAEVVVNLDTANAVARWTITAIDPFTLEPMEDTGEGVLPPNTDGNGVARVYYQINLRDTFPDGTDVTNQAYITFDYEEAIATPVWTNTVDAEAPTSSISYGNIFGDSLTVSFAASDNRSGVWRYDLMGRNDSLDVWRTISSRTDNVQTIIVDSLLSDFCVIAVDSAGIREKKNLNTEYNRHTGLTTPGISTYLVQFLNYDNSILSHYRLAQGQKPKYIGQKPVKPEDNHFRYTFSEWSPALAPVTGSATYHAVFDSIPKNFMIRFLSATGDTLQSDSVAYGSMPKYLGSIPEHSYSDTMIYSFTGWNPPLGLVQGHTDYTPAFDSCKVDNLRKYSVSFIDWNDSILYQDSMFFGSIPYYGYRHPSREANEYYRYSFAGWSSEVMPVTRNAVYKAMYDSAAIKYTVRFVNYNGATLQLDSLSYGDTAVYVGHTPVRRTTRSHVYNFVGWSPINNVVTSDMTYTAQFDSVLNTYTVTFVDAAGAILSQQILSYGDSIEFVDSLLVLTDVEPYRYVFKGWTPNDSVVTSDCILKPVIDTTFFCTDKYVSQSIAIGGSIVWRGKTLTSSGIYTDTVVGASFGQCDSIYTLTLTINPSYSFEDTASICQGESFNWHNHALAETGIYYDYLQTLLGEDSVYKLTLTVNPSYLIEESMAIGQDESYSWHGRALTNAGVYYDSLQTIAGCDSVYKLTLTVNPSYLFEDEESICQGESFRWHGHTLTETGIYFDSLVTQQGEDSVYKLTFTVYPSYSSQMAVSICQGESYLWRGQYYSQAGTYIDTFQTIHGCDSIHKMVLTINPTYLIEDSISICQGETYHWHGNNYTESGVYYDSLWSLYGCDSIHKLTLTVNPTYIFEESYTICQGETYNWHNRALTMSGTYYDSLSTSTGCDSVCELTLTVNSSYMIETGISICQGDTYSWRNNTYSESGVYYDSLQTILGCDSVYKLSLTVYPACFIEDEESICQGESFRWHGRALTESGIYYDSLMTDAGCDSVCKLTLTVNPTYLVNDTAVLPSDGSGYQWRGQSYSEAGDYADSYKTVSGCDSVYTLHLIDSTSTGIDYADDVSAVKIHVVPNPVHPGMVAYVYGEFGEVETVEILNNSGQVIDRFAPSSYPIEIDGLEVDGLYYVRIITRSGEIFTEKLLVK